MSSFKDCLTQAGYSESEIKDLQARLSNYEGTEVEQQAALVADLENEIYSEYNQIRTQLGFEPVNPAPTGPITQEEQGEEAQEAVPQKQAQEANQESWRTVPLISNPDQPGEYNYNLNPEEVRDTMKPEFLSEDGGIMENEAQVDPNAKASFKKATDPFEAVAMDQEVTMESDRIGQVAQIFYMYQGKKKVGTVLKHDIEDPIKSSAEYTHLESGLSAIRRGDLVKKVQEWAANNQAQQQAALESNKPGPVPKHTILRGPEEAAFRQRSAAKQAGKRLMSTPVENAGRLANSYKAKKGMPIRDEGIITKLDTEYAKGIADAFEAMEHNPDDPEVKAAYQAMADETLEQYQHILDDGHTFEIFEGEGEPYGNSEEMLADVRDNKHMYILSTVNDFGSTPITDQMREENPLLKDSGYKDVNGQTLLVNDVFRGVHDFFGHSVRGNSFGPTGEENAWAEHVSMYSPLAARAMTTETRGQNSWVNFGPHMRNEDGTIKKRSDKGWLGPRDRPFADQKIGLLPQWVSTPLETSAVTANARPLIRIPELEAIDLTKVDEELNKELQEVLAEKYPEIKLNITANPIWETGPTVFNQEVLVNDRLPDVLEDINDVFKIPVTYDPEQEVPFILAGNRVIISKAALSLPTSQLVTSMFIEGVLTTDRFKELVAEYPNAGDVIHSVIQAKLLNIDIRNMPEDQLLFKEVDEALTNEFINTAKLLYNPKAYRDQIDEEARMGFRFAPEVDKQSSIPGEDPGFVLSREDVMAGTLDRVVNDLYYSRFNIFPPIHVMEEDHLTYLDDVNDPFEERNRFEDVWAGTMDGLTLGFKDSSNTLRIPLPMEMKKQVEARIKAVLHYVDLNKEEFVESYHALERELGALDEEFLEKRDVLAEAIQERDALYVDSPGAEFRELPFEVDKKIEELGGFTEYQKWLRTDEGKAFRQREEEITARYKEWSEATRVANDLTDSLMSEMEALQKKKDVVGRIVSPTSFKAELDLYIPPSTYQLDQLLQDGGFDDTIDFYNKISYAATTVPLREGAYLTMGPLISKYGLTNQEVDSLMDGTNAAIMDLITSKVDSAAYRDPNKPISDDFNIQYLPVPKSTKERMTVHSVSTYGESGMPNIGTIKDFRKAGMKVTHDLGAFNNKGIGKVLSFWDSLQNGKFDTISAAVTNLRRGRGVIPNLSKDNYLITFRDNAEVVSYFDEDAYTYRKDRDYSQGPIMTYNASWPVESSKEAIRIEQESQLSEDLTDEQFNRLLNSHKDGEFSELLIRFQPQMIETFEVIADEIPPEVLQMQEKYGFTVVRYAPRSGGSRLNAKPVETVKPAKKPSPKTTYNQENKGQLIGQANIDAMTVLIDAVNQRQDTLPHEYAHHYIAWFRDTPIVQEGIKRFGSEEKLVQAIGEQAARQRGRAYNWWKRFTNFVLNLMGDKEVLQVLTDSFLNRTDLSSNYTYSNAPPTDTRTTPEQNREKEVLARIDELMKPTIPQAAINNVQRALRTIDPNIEVIFHETVEDFQAAGGNLETARWDVEDNKIHINGPVAKVKDLYHEAAHVVLMAKFGTDEDALIKFANGVADKLSLGNRSEREIAGKIRALAEKYGALEAAQAGTSEAAIQAEEMMAELAGILADGKISIKPDRWRRVWSYVRDFFGTIFGRERYFDFRSPDEGLRFLNDMASRLREGESLRTLDSGKLGEVQGARYRISDNMTAIEPSIKEKTSFITNAIEMAESRTFADNNEIWGELERRFAEEDLPALKAQYGEDFDPSLTNDDAGRTPEVKKYYTDVLTAEALVAIAAIPEAIDWYKTTLDKAFKVVSLVHPELKTDAGARTMMNIATAVYSNSQKVAPNYEAAEIAYRAWKETGRFPIHGQGKAAKAMKNSFKLVNDMLDIGMTPADIREFLTTKMKVGDLDYRKGKEKKNPVSGENKSTEVFGASVFGPKVGNGFFMNLEGEYGQLTMDRWFMRTWNRIGGKLRRLTPESVQKANDRAVVAMDAVLKDPKARAILESILPQTIDLYNSFTPPSFESLVAGNTPVLSENVFRVIADSTSEYKIRTPLTKNKLTDELRKAANSLNDTYISSIDAPLNGAQRVFIREVFSDILTNLEKDHGIVIEMADLQAALWFPEKALYVGATSASKTFQKVKEEYQDEGAPDYYQGALLIAKQNGFTDEQIEQALREPGSERVGGRTGEAGSSSTDPGSSEKVQGERVKRLIEAHRAVREGTPNVRFSLDGGLRDAVKQLMKEFPDMTAQEVRNILMARGIDIPTDTLLEIQNEILEDAVADQSKKMDPNQDAAMTAYDVETLQLRNKSMNNLRSFLGVDVDLEADKKGWDDSFQGALNYLGEAGTTIAVDSEQMFTQITGPDQIVDAIRSGFIPNDEQMLALGATVVQMTEKLNEMEGMLTRMIARDDRGGAAAMQHAVAEQIAKLDAYTRAIHTAGTNTARALAVRNAFIKRGFEERYYSEEMMEERLKERIKLSTGQRAVSLSPTQKTKIKNLARDIKRNQNRIRAKQAQMRQDGEKIMMTQARNAIADIRNMPKRRWNRFGKRPKRKDQFKAEGVEQTKSLAAAKDQLINLIKKGIC